MTFQSIDTWWWPYVFILIGGWLATDSWRYLGVFLGDRISADSDILVLVRAIATALVAAVIADLVIAPSGALGEAPMALRVGAAAAGFGTYLVAGRSILASIAAAEIILVPGMIWL